MISTKPMAALSSVIRTVLCSLSENETLAALDIEKVIIRGKFLLRVMATEYSEHGKIVTCAIQWNRRVDDVPDESCTSYNSLDIGDQI